MDVICMLSCIKLIILLALWYCLKDWSTVFIANFIYLSANESVFQRCHKSGPVSNACLINKRIGMFGCWEAREFLFVRENKTAKNIYSTQEARYSTPYRLYSNSIWFSSTDVDVCRCVGHWHLSILFFFNCKCFQGEVRPKAEWTVGCTHLFCLSIIYWLWNCRTSDNS